eukprot:TRINITY_DN401_c0_g1_i10.p2 TRINITY_DN401_c0_g1~~TRINITY_DN401_c0_g1_i10.p2  ORF type:complete len:281 (-),score=17.78 TRINITY_DN401_c0_g1_i10:439-1281(-)
MSCLCCGYSGESRSPLKINDNLQTGSQEPLVEPVVTDSLGEVEFSRKLSRQLSSIQSPRNIESGKTDTAFVNVTSFKENQSEQQPCLLLKTPKQGGLNWTESRRALEYALEDSHNQYQVHNDGLTEEHRLQNRLFTLGLVQYNMRGDGNCQFRSIAWWLYGNQNEHNVVRRRALDYMRQNKGEFECFLGQDVPKYLKQMCKDREWGDELTLRAICESYGLVLNVISSQQNNWFLRYIPKHTLIQKEVFLTYIAPVHYNAIRRQSSIAALSRRLTISRRKS